MKEYDQLLDAADTARIVGFGVFTAAVFTAVVAFWEPEARFLAVVLVLLASHLLTGYWALKRLASMQAALDMKRVAFDARRTDALAVQRIQMTNGDSYEMRARDGTAFVVIPNCSVELKVEYCG